MKGTTSLAYRISEESNIIFLLILKVHLLSFFLRIILNVFLLHPLTVDKLLEGIFLFQSCGNPSHNITLQRAYSQCRCCNLLNNFQNSWKILMFLESN